jgi:hypothetical protein
MNIVWPQVLWRKGTIVSNKEYGRRVAQNGPKSGWRLFEAFRGGLDDHMNSIRVVMCPMGLGRALDDVLTKLEKALRSLNLIEIVRGCSKSVECVRSGSNVREKICDCRMRLERGGWIYGRTFCSRSDHVRVVQGLRWWSNLIGSVQDSLNLSRIDRTDTWTYDEQWGVQPIDLQSSEHEVILSSGHGVCGYGFNCIFNKGF